VILPGMGFDPMPPNVGVGSIDPTPGGCGGGVCVCVCVCVWWSPYASDFFQIIKKKKKSKTFQKKERSKLKTRALKNTPSKITRHKTYAP